MKFKVMLTDEAKEDLKELAPDYQKLVKDDFNTIEKVGLEYVARKQLEKKLFEIWNDAASKNPGAKLAECNVMINKEIANAFITVKSDCNHPFYWAGVNQYPFILVYRGGWPQAFYNGNRTTLDIINYSLQLACKSCYTEKEQKFKGIGVDTSIQETSANPISPTPTKSTNFIGGNYRGYGTPIYQNATYGNATYGNAK